MAMDLKQLSRPLLTLGDGFADLVRKLVDDLEGSRIAAKDELNQVER